MKTEAERASGVQMEGQRVRAKEEVEPQMEKR